MTDNKALMRAFDLISRREQRERIAKSMRIVKAAKKAGCSRVTVDGATFEFSEQGTVGTGNELDQWIATQHDSRSLERH